jgi:hypothetical protein
MPVWESRNFDDHERVEIVSNRKTGLARECLGLAEQ